MENIWLNLSNQLENCILKNRDYTQLFDAITMYYEIT